MTGPTDDTYAKARTERQARVTAVLGSQSRKKIVVAGAGAGKTFLFKEILKTKNNALTLTFVNSLVEDLSLDLCGLSIVKTLHGFARGVMANAKESARVFPKLSKIVSEDANILTGEKIDFDSLFQNRDDKSKQIEFYKKRKAYYGYYGFTDIIYAAVLYLEKHRDKIPRHDQVLVDEFQDFNHLEVSLIDLLSSINPVLIAGDDDQSLYFFKNANPNYIRQRYSLENKEYESFNLPHCSRCTRVIVGAVNDVVAAAIKEGFLKGRIDKPYVFFDEINKDAECKRYPKIAHITCFSTQVPHHIAGSIRQIAEERREKFSALIIAPTKTRCRSIAKGLKGKGLGNVSYVDQERTDDPTLIDCLTLLSENPKCNLGWRIAAKLYLPEEELKIFVEISNKENPTDAYDLLPESVRDRIKPAMATFKKIAKGKSVSDEKSKSLLDELGWNTQIIAQNELRDKIALQQPRIGDPATRNIPIKITTIPSSKGLADDYVFIVDFDDRFFLEKDRNCSDQKIYDFIVALTRARRKVFLISSERKEPKLLTWIAKDKIEKVSF
jgi:superfamily I DNA/RNA helicase